MTGARGSAYPGQPTKKKMKKAILLSVLATTSLLLAGEMLFMGGPNDYEGRIQFDIPRHRLHFGFKQDWPRMNAEGYRARRHELSNHRSTSHDSD
jgi:hypothetical protein